MSIYERDPSTGELNLLAGSGGGGGSAEIKKATYEETTALHNHSVGALIVLIDNGVTTLYKVTSAITEGDTISATGQNANVTTNTGVGEDVQVYISGIVGAESVPDGKTVTPTDDVQMLLACAGITDKSYTTLNELLADTTTLQSVISSENAIDYLVRSTTWASGICANQTAMSYVGLNNYASNTLLADTDWLNAIADSAYMESVLNVKVPTMTSDTTPSGEVFASGSLGDDYAEWHAFDGTVYNWQTNPQGSATNIYVGYSFVSPICVKKIYTSMQSSTITSIQYKFQASNDKANWDDISEVLTNTAGATLVTNNENTYQHYRLFIISQQLVGGWGTGRVDALQFYGREDV